MMKNKNVLKYIHKREHGFRIQSDSKVCASHSNATHRYVEEKATLPTKNMSCELSGQSRSTFLITFSADGQYVGSTHGDHTVRVSYVKTGRCLRVLTGHPRTPWCIAFHPHSSSVLASGCLAGEVRIWDINYGGSEVWRSSQGTVITSLAFHPCGHVILMATTNKIFFWDWSKPAPFAECVTSSVYEKVRWMEFDSSGRYLYTGIANTTTVQRPDADHIRYTDQPQEGAANRQLLQNRYSRIVEQITTVQRDRLMHISEPDWSAPRQTTEQPASSNSTVVAREGCAALIQSEPLRQRNVDDCDDDSTAASEMPANTSEVRSKVNEVTRQEDEWLHVNPSSPVHAEALREAHDYASYVTLQSATSSGTSQAVGAELTTRVGDLPSADATERVQSEYVTNSVEGIINVELQQDSTGNGASESEHSVDTGHGISADGATGVESTGDNQNADANHEASALIGSATSASSADERARREALQDLIRSAEYSELVSRTAEQPVGPLSRNLLAVFSASQFLTGSVQGDVVDSFFRSRLIPAGANDEPSTAQVTAGDDDMRSRSGSCSSNSSESSIRSNNSSSSSSCDSSGGGSNLQRACFRRKLNVLAPVSLIGATGGVCSDAISPAGNTSTSLSTADLPPNENDGVSFKPSVPVSCPSIVESASATPIDSTNEATPLEDEPPPSKRAKKSSLTSMIAAALMKGNDASDDDAPSPRWSFTVRTGRNAPARETSTKPSGENTACDGNGGSRRMASLIESEVRLALGGSAALSQHEVGSRHAPKMHAQTAHSMSASCTDAGLPDRNCSEAISRNRQCGSAHAKHMMMSSSHSSSVKPTRSVTKPDVCASSSSRIALWSCSRNSAGPSTCETDREDTLPRYRVIPGMDNLLLGRKRTKEQDTLKLSSVQEAGPSCQKVGPSKQEVETRRQEAGPSRQEAETSRQEAETSRQDAGTSSHEAGTSSQEAGPNRLEAGHGRQKAWPSRLKAKLSGKCLASDEDLMNQSMKQLDKKVLSIHWRVNQHLVHGSSGDTPAQSAGVSDPSRQDTGKGTSQKTASKNTEDTNSAEVTNPDTGVPPSRLQQEIEKMRTEAARRQQASRHETWHALQRRHLHPHYAVSILDDTINRQSDGLQAAINRAIAGAFVARGEASVASNINNLTHRIQRWQLKHWDSQPAISESMTNVVVPHCKLHNDASCEISSDGHLFAAFVPSHQGFPDDTILGVFSLRPDTLGQCLYTKSFGPNGISVSLSPLNNYVLVGLAAKRLAWIVSPKQMVAQVYRLKSKFTGELSMELVCDLMHPCDMDEHNNVSVNSARWLPGVGQGMAYCTNRGDLHICSPVFGDTPLKGSADGESDSVRRNLLHMLGLGRTQVAQRGTQTLLRVHQAAGTQTEYEYDSGHE